MTARIGRVYSRTEQSTTRSPQSTLSSTDQRLLFVSRRERVREAMSIAARVVAWTAAIVGLVAIFWSAL